MSKNSTDGQWGVQINLKSCDVVGSSKNHSYISYVFVFHIQNDTHVFKTRYSTLAKLHERLLRSGILDRAFKFSPPNFPGKYWFKDMTKPKNYQKRGEELLLYLRALVSKPTILKFADFQAGIELPDHLRQSVAKVADDMKSRKVLMNQFPNESPSSRRSYDGQSGGDRASGGHSSKNGKQVLKTGGSRQTDDTANPKHSTSENNQGSDIGDEGGEIGGGIGDKGIGNIEKEQNDGSIMNTTKESNKTMEKDMINNSMRDEKKGNNMNNYSSGTIGQNTYGTLGEHASQVSTDDIMTGQVKLSAEMRKEQEMMAFKHALKQLTENTEQELVEIMENTAADVQELNEFEDEYRDILEPLKIFRLSDIMEVEEERYEYPSITGGQQRALQIINGEITYEMDGLDVIKDLGTRIRDLLLSTCDLGGSINNNMQSSMPTMG